MGNTDSNNQVLIQSQIAYKNIEEKIKHINDLEVKDKCEWLLQFISDNFLACQKGDLIHVNSNNMYSNLHFLIEKEVLTKECSNIIIALNKQRRKRQNGETYTALSSTYLSRPKFIVKKDDTKPDENQNIELDQKPS
jgi:hypothetical protein